MNEQTTTQIHRAGKAYPDRKHMLWDCKAGCVIAAHDEMLGDHDVPYVPLGHGVPKQINRGHILSVVCDGGWCAAEHG